MASLGDILGINFEDIIEELPKNSWVWYKSKNKEYASELKQKDRPWLLSETFYDEPTPSALAYGRTRNPKGNKKNNFEHKKYPNFTDTGWIVRDRESLDIDDCKFFQIEKNAEIQHEIKNFYKKNRY